MLKIAVVEDQTEVRESLCQFIRQYAGEQGLQAEVEPFADGAVIAEGYQPGYDIIFLDVEMPYGNAFDVLEGCKDLYFETIFVTAFSEYSLRALNQSAAYYLLKPVSIEELILAVNKVQQHIVNREIFNRNQILIENMREPKPEKRQVILPTLEGFEVIKMEDIIRLQGNGNFTDIYLKDKSKKMVCRFLKYFSEILPFPFVRVHKSHIINLHCVRSYHKNSGGYIVLEDNTEIEISSSYKDDFLRLLKSQ